MQSMHIARQALHLVVLLNDSIDEKEGPTDEQQDERIDLGDELIELEEAMRKWGAANGAHEECAERISVIERHYLRLFKSRFYFDAGGSSSNTLLQRLIEYDMKTLAFEQWQRPSTPTERMEEPQGKKPKAFSLPKKPRRKSAKSQNARVGSTGSPVQADTNGEPAYRLSRVQKIVKMNGQDQISREAVFVMALAAEHIACRLTRASCEIAKKAQRLDLSLSDVATAVQASTSLCFLAEVVPQTIPLSTARSLRLTKDITPYPPDTTKAMISRLQDQLRRSARPITANTTTASKIGTVGGVVIPIAAIMPPLGGRGDPAPVRNYSPREVAAVAKSKVEQ